jgi:FkbM family methyltransferase
VIQPKFVCLDLGANVGLFTKQLSILSAEVTAVEPIQETFIYLRHSLKDLGRKNVKLLNTAVSDHEGTVSMEMNLWEDGRPNPYQAHVSSDHGKIPSTTVDSICRDFGRLDLIKCDVEGHEAAVLRGAQETIKRFKPIWLLETERNSEAFRTLVAAGYKVMVATRGVLSDDDGKTSAVNYWFMPSFHDPSAQW